MSALIDRLKDDHLKLRKYLRTLSSESEDHTDKVEAFADLVPVLKGHSLAEERVVYSYMKEIEDLHEMAMAGQEEHRLIEMLVERIQRTDSDDKWNARAKVLADLLLHHLEDEEDRVFPALAKTLSRARSQEMAEVYQKAYVEAATTSPVVGVTWSHSPDNDVRI